MKQEAGLLKNNEYYVVFLWQGIDTKTEEYIEPDGVYDGVIKKYWLNLKTQMNENCKA